MARAQDPGAHVEKLASVSEQAQMEVLYRNKMIKEREEKKVLMEEEAQAKEEKNAAKHQVTNLEKKITGDRSTSH